MTNEPILEALAFSLDTDLHVQNVRTTKVTSEAVSSSSSASRLGGQMNMTWSAPSTSTSTELWEPVDYGYHAPKNSKSMLPSAVILGEDVTTKTPCPIVGCEVIAENLSKKEHKDDFLGHLLREHRLVIDDVDDIANLHK
jgi:hypothetical protein